ncbi:expressed unknown protein [Seminavis robusta]|uniref:Uncharacterized protein n=1 Tax=Seminavis robusta TaxID=568900 RepID=A0A9N8H4F8_9STRA|nr:expressed unknown protein [Seminavis robusta]|eukprot:Sro61_g035200.1 n/a (540) ;mRNA; r:126589-128208
MLRFLFTGNTGGQLDRLQRHLPGVGGGEEEPSNDNRQLLDLLVDPRQLPPHHVQRAAIDWQQVVTVALENPLTLHVRDQFRLRTPLFLAIERDAPPFVIQAFLQSYPPAARVVQKIGLTPLHLAVARGAHNHVVQYLLGAWPEAASYKMSDGCVPLHFARNVETARLLIEAYPEALWVANKAAYLPIHRVVYAPYASPEVVKRFLDAELKVVQDSDDDNASPNKNKKSHEQESQLLAKTIHGITPLDAACEMVFRDLNHNQRDGDDNNNNTPPVVSPEKWEKLLVLAKHTYDVHQSGCRRRRRRPSSTLHSMPLGMDKPLLHILLQYTSIELQVLPLVLQYILNHKYPEQRAMVDKGRSALAIAVSRPNMSGSVVKLLLQDPVLRAMATVTDVQGRLPLHSATASGHRDGLEELMRAAPVALTIPDPVTGLYPCLLAAATATDDGDDDDCQEALSVNAIYSLLRETPSIVPTMSSTCTETAVTGKRGLTQSQHEVALLGKTLSAAKEVYVWWILPILLAFLLHDILIDAIFERNDINDG